MNTLALTGGGCLGYSEVLVLMELEKRAGKLSKNLFEFIGGTSVGSIIAAGLALGIPASQIQSFFTVDAPKIFDASWLDDIESLAGAKYGDTELVKALTAMLGDAELSDCQTKFIATAYDFASDRPIYFKSYDASFQDDTAIIIGNDSSVKLAEICRMSAAAQTYFQAVQWNNMVVMDGGNAGDNAPDSLMIAESMGFTTIEQIKMLSLGSGVSKWDVNPTSMVNPSKVRAGLETIKIVFSAGESADIYKAKRILGNRHYRLSPDLGDGIAIDDAQGAIQKIPAAVAALLAKSEAVLDEFTA